MYAQIHALSVRHGVTVPSSPSRPIYRRWGSTVWRCRTSYTPCTGEARALPELHSDPDMTL